MGGEGKGWDWRGGEGMGLDQRGGERRGGEGKECSQSPPPPL